MAGREPDFGPTAKAVAGNVERLRRERGLNYKELSATLKSVAGWSLSPVAIRRIEDQLRRVTVDDLTALAVALKVTPTTLLMPPAFDPDEPVDGPTGTKARLPAGQMWDWLTVVAPLPGMEYVTPQEFIHSAMPDFAAVEASGPESRITRREATQMVDNARREEYRRLFIEGWRPPKKESADHGDD